MRSDDKENEEGGGAKNGRREAVEERAGTEQTVKQIVRATKGTGDRTRNEKNAGNNWGDERTYDRADMLNFGQAVDKTNYVMTEQTKKHE